MQVLPIVLAMGASGATLAGGMLALWLRRRQGLVAALSAGIVIGVALFDLLPEALGAGSPDQGPRYVATAMAAAFGLYLVMSRLPMAFFSSASLPTSFAPATLTIHSLIDGMGIGIGFRLSSALGWSVALAVLSHDLADGVNIVGASLASQDDSSARKWLAANAAAPVIGTLIGQFITLSEQQFVPIVSALAGIFIYIGAAELLPRSQQSDRRLGAACATALGLCCSYVVTLAQG